MTVTYDLSSSDAATVRRSRVRLELGDETVGAGVRPGGGNLTDAEIDVWLAAEEHDPLRATAAACEALSRIWSTQANLTVGPRKEDLAAVASAWAARAKELRAQVGGGGSTGGAFSGGFCRHDGYSEAADASL